MSVGVSLSNDDLIAIKRLYEVRWSGDIKNWKERGTDYCLWFVSCPNSKGQTISATGQSLAIVIDNLLLQALE